MYFIVESGGKQYWAEKGSKLVLEKVEIAEGEIIELKVVAFFDNDKKIEFKEKTVKAKVIKHEKAKKVIAFKKKRRKGHEKKIGHRQKHTFVEILG